MSNHKGRLYGWGRRLDEIAETRYLPCMVVLLALGVVLRLLLIWATTSPMDPLNRLYPGYTDGGEYMDNARSLVEEGIYGYAGRPSAFRPPAYPFLIALTWWLFGDTLTPLRLLQVGLSVVTTMVYAGAVRRHFGRASGLLTAGALSLYPLLAFLATEIATESLYMALASVLFAMTFRLIEPGVEVRKRTGMAFLAGLLCGAGTLTRPNMYFVFLLLAGMMIWGGVRRRERWYAWMSPALGIALGTYLVLCPWMIRNARVVGAPVLTTNLSYNFFRGTFDLVEGVPKDTSIYVIFRNHHVLYEEEIEDTGIKVLTFSEIESERNAKSAALSIIRADPLDWVWQRCRNALYLWLNLQWDSTLLHKTPLVFLAGASTTIGYYFLLAGGLIGTLFLWRSAGDSRQRQFLLVAWLYMAAAMPTVMTFVGKRYRLSMIDPYLAILASVALAVWLHRRSGHGGLREEIQVDSHRIRS